jgi:hypothetical protein
VRKLTLYVSCFEIILDLKEYNCLNNSEEETQLDYALRGKAWKVYWFLLKSGQPQSVRDVQQALRFTSPSIASHHLEKIRELDLVQKQEIGGHYFLNSEVKIGILRQYVKLGKILFPRYFFYAAFSTTSYLAYLILFLQSLSREYLLTMFFGAFVCAIFWYEAFRIWSMRPY